MPQEILTLVSFDVLKNKEYYSIFNYLPEAVSQIHFFTIGLQSTADEIMENEDLESFTKMDTE